MARLLRSLLKKFDTLTLSLEHLGTIKPMSVEEVLGSLRLHESRLLERDSCEEEQALLTKAANWSNKGDRGQSSKGRERFHQRGRGRGRGRGK